MEKLLPIKFIEKRKRDEQLTEAGGSKELPKWVLQGDALEEHSRHLSGGMTQVTAEYESRKKEEHELPMVMATTITDKAIAKSHRGTVVDFLNSDSNPNVIGVESVTPVVSEPEDKEGVAEEQTEEPKETRRLLSIVTTE